MGSYISYKKDHQLVESYNAGVQLRVWGTARMKYIHHLKNEFLARNWDASILFCEDKNTFSLAKQVVLENGKLMFQL